MEHPALSNKSGISSLRIEKLSKSFSQGMRIATILESAHFTFERGCSVALTGVSGTGKSTLLHLLAGLEMPTSGSLFFNERTLESVCASERMHFLQKTFGLVFQSPYLIDELSVIENIMIKGLIAGEGFEAASKRAYELLECVGLTHKAQNATCMLSGGEQQRVALARALFSEPDFILADEPTAHLDSETKNAIIDLLLLCRKRWGVGLIIATHDESVAQRMDVVLRLENGNLVRV